APTVDNDVADVFSLKVAIARDFRLQEELAKAIESHRIPSLVVLIEFNDRNDHNSSISNPRMRRRLRWRAGPILGVINVFLDVRVGRLQSGIQATGVIIKSCVDPLFDRPCVGAWFCVDAVSCTWSCTKIDAAPQPDSHVAATGTSNGENLHIACRN